MLLVRLNDVERNHQLDQPRSFIEIHRHGPSQQPSSIFLLPVLPLKSLQTIQQPIPQPRIHTAEPHSPAREPQAIRNQRRYRQRDTSGRGEGER